MTKNDHFETQNVIFERLWPLSKFHFPACSTLMIIFYKNLFYQDWRNNAIVPHDERKKRSLANPTEEWFHHAQQLFEHRGEHASYFQAQFGDIFQRAKRGADELEEGNSNFTYLLNYLQYQF